MLAQPLRLDIKVCALAYALGQSPERVCVHLEGSLLQLLLLGLVDWSACGAPKHFSVLFLSSHAVQHCKLSGCGSLQRRFSQRSDRVKGVDLHPTEPWCARWFVLLQD